MRCFLLLLLASSLFSAETPGWTDDFNAAVKNAHDGNKRIFVLIRDAGDVASQDCAKWLRTATDLDGVLGNAQRVIVWRGHPLVETLKAPNFLGMALCDSDGAVLAVEPIPDFRDQLKAAVERMFTRADAKEPLNLTLNGIERLVQGLPEETGSLAREMMKDIKDTAKVRERIESLLKRELPRDSSARLCALLGFVIFEKSFDDLKPVLREKVKREAPRGRLSADIFLDFADDAFAQGKHEDAAELWEAALAASDGESPVLRQAVNVALWSVGGVDASAATPFAKRTAKDVVVLVHDMPSYLNAIARWSDDEFFPVLFAEDVYAPKFIEAFKPETVVEIQPAETKHEADLAELRHVLIESWRSGEPKAREAKTENDLSHELTKHHRTPRGIVIWDGSAPEIAGAIALAAGRFQPLEKIEPLTDASGKKLQIHDHAKAADIQAFGSRVQELLRHWSVRSQGWTYVTLAGAYPYRFQGPADGIGKGTSYAVDDWVGRDEDGVRNAVVGRLIGDPARSAYQAMCSLFLQPQNTLLFNTYGLDPKSIWGQYRMDFSVEAFDDLLNVKHIKGNDANVRSFHRVTLPWNNYGLVLINSSGGTQDWSVGGGGGSTDDMVVGGPCAIHMTHSNSAGNPYDASTIAGRALQGGAYFYFGSTSEPYLTSFQPPSYYAPRIAAGTPFAAAFRKRSGQMFAQPWRLMIVGDPQAGLRSRPLKREKYDAEDNEKVVSIAQFSQTAAKYEGLLRKWPPEETIAAWKRADATERSALLVRLYARQAYIQLLDKSLDTEDEKTSRELLLELLATQPVHRFTERSIESVSKVIEKKENKAAAIEWLKKQSTDAPESYRGLFTARVKKMEEAK